MSFRLRVGDLYTEECTVNPVSRSQSAVLHNTFPIAHKLTLPFKGRFISPIPAVNAAHVLAFTEVLRSSGLPVAKTCADSLELSSNGVRTRCESQY